MIQADGNAPAWAQRLAADTQTEIDNAIGLFVSRVPFTVAQLTATDASKHTNKIAFLSDGTFWLAKSNGTNWIYPNMAAI